MNYYERHLGDYAKDTAHLSMLEHGAYSLLLDRYYGTEQGIPADQVHRIARARTDLETAAVDEVLKEFFILVDGVWHNRRADEEIEKTRARITAAVENGKRGGRPRKKPDESQTKAKITQPFQSGSENKTQQKPNPKAKRKPNESSPDSIHHTPIGKTVTSRAKLDDLEKMLRDAGGAALDQTAVDLFALARPLAWIVDGCDLDLDIIPTLRRLGEAAPPARIRSWKYFEQAVADAKANRLAPMPQGNPQDGTIKRSGNAARVSSDLGALLASGNPDGTSGLDS